MSTDTSRNMAVYIDIPHTYYSRDGILKKRDIIPLDTEEPKSKNFKGEIKLRVQSDAFDGNELMNNTIKYTPSMTEALACLRQTRADIPDLTYPEDALQHFNDIHDRLGRWVQQPNHKPHRAVGYRGPWIENRWISHFQQELESKNYSDISDVFGPYIPIFIPWTDIWVKNRHTYPKDLVSAMKDLLRENVLYITINQNADGFVGRCTEFNDLQSKFSITVLSAGGYGHVPIPLLKQPEKTLQKIPLDERKHLISYVGKNTNAPNHMREEMIAQNNHFYYYGKKWRNVMAQSKFSLCPRGYGRTSYHVMEALQMGLIPIQVYQDEPWLPYENLMKNISYTVNSENLPDLITQLSKMPDSEIAKIEKRIETLRNDYFSFEGALMQISKFMLNPKSSELVCQAMPLDSGSKNKKPKSCRHGRRRKRSSRQRNRPSI